LVNIVAFSVSVVSLFQNTFNFIGIPCIAEFYLFVALEHFILTTFLHFRC